MQDNREERIRQRAHEIWEREGQPEGKHDEHWSRATSEIDAEIGDKGTKGKTATKGKGAGKTTAAKDEATKTTPAKSGAKAKSNGSATKGSTRAAAENLSAVAGGKPRKAGTEASAPAATGTATRGRTARAAKKDATG